MSVGGGLLRRFLLEARKPCAHVGKRGLQRGALLFPGGQGAAECLPRRILLQRLNPLLQGRHCRACALGVGGPGLQCVQAGVEYAECIGANADGGGRLGAGPGVGIGTGCRMGRHIDGTVQRRFLLVWCRHRRAVGSRLS